MSGDSQNRNRTRRGVAASVAFAVILLALGAIGRLPAFAQERGATPPAANAPAAHAEGGAAEGHGEAKTEEEGVSIHLPSWIYGTLKQAWYRGPATLAADGAVAEDGGAVDAASLKGAQVEYRYEDHHAHGSPKPVFDIRPVVGAVGGRTSAIGAKTEHVSINGRQVTLINPTVTFAYQGMFPEHLVISLWTAICIALVAFFLTRNLERIPSRRQAFVEFFYTAADSFVRDLIGPHYKKYLPLAMTAFIYILVMNLAGLLPGWTSATANINVTAGLALVVVPYVQWEGIRANGIVGYLKHFAGEPWWLVPLNFPIHAIGEAAKLLSLSIRLFGNIFGEDVVLVIMMYLSYLATKGYVPFQLPMCLLAAFTSFVQALVFTILTCVYINLMTSHAEEHESHGAGHSHGATPAHA